uniref:Uncharacterized protein n=1 Tax=uncultured marine virus TaxID=186617 RepID=A0A0F7L8A6_9VIRU|nr:hypothetical protein [uncultured marine virus]
MRYLQRYNLQKSRLHTFIIKKIANLHRNKRKRKATLTSKCGFFVSNKNTT